MRRRVEIFLPCLLAGGTEQSTLLLARSLLAGGYRVGVVNAYESDETMVRAYRDAGVGLYSLARRRPQGILALIREYAGLVAELRRRWRRVCPDAVHVQYVAPGLAPILAARLARVPVVMATVHQCGRGYGFLPHFLIRISSRLCRRFVCVSEAVHKSWFAEPPAPTRSREVPAGRRVTLWNAVDVRDLRRQAARSDVAGLRQELDIPPQVPIITFLGRLHRVKGTDSLLTAAAWLAKADEPFAVVIAGDGPERETLIRRADELGLRNHCRWLGRVAPRDVPCVLAVSDIVTVPSRAEGFGLVALEAMALGKPVVASDIDGLREVIEPGISGELVKTGHDEGFGRVLLDLIRTPGRRAKLGRAATHRAVSQFGSDRFRDQVLALYRSEFAAAA